MADTTAKEAPKVPEFVTMDLDEPITISNVKNTWKFPKGENIEVPAELADEVRRINRDHVNYKLNLQKKNVFEVNSGTIAVGGGAE